MEVTRSSICFITRESLHGTQEHQEISPLRFAPVEMTKEGTRGQLYGSHEYKEIPLPRSAPVGMIKEGCANEQSPKVAQASGLHVCLARNPEECATFSAQVVSTLGVR